MKSILIILAVTILVLTVVAIVFLPSRLSILSGYAAKSMCSCVFISNRDQKSIEEVDLNFSFLNYATNEIDFKNKSVTSNVFGFKKRTAVYREGLGCCLVNTAKNISRNILIENAVEEFKVEKPDAISSLPWPYGDQIADTVFKNINYEKLTQAVDSGFDTDGKHKKNSRAVLVVYKNQLVLEKYAEGFDFKTPQLGWSMSKSVTNTMMGMRVDEGLLSIDQKAPVPEWKNTDKENITINHLMHMSSGLEWNEEYGDMSDATVMLYEQSNKALYAIEKPLVASPGSEWVYSSGTTNILQQLIRSTFDSDIAYWEFPYKKLFHKIGMYDTYFETDPAGLYVGSSYVYATPRDWARFGLLYLNEGKWNGEQIISQEWVEYSKSEAPASQGVYGAQFWLNLSKEYPDAPEDMYRAQGFHGQRVFIIPSMDLVIVRLGVSPGETFDHNAYLKGILQSIDSTQQL